ncbi:hypothetical protein AHiyo4_29780 [Arthrobacter sp. Hiyo4]|nr:hypothetical protein AHiyo4_29780 [Arthrobacter sp. Hiyo4]
MDDGARKLAAGASQLAAALTPSTAGNAENNLADGATALDAGAGRLASGTGELAAGTARLKGYRGANNSPEAGTGTAALAQALSCWKRRRRTRFRGWCRCLWSRTRSPRSPLVPIGSTPGRSNCRPARGSSMKERHSCTREQGASLLASPRWVKSSTAVIPTTPALCWVPNCWPPERHRSAPAWTACLAMPTARA